MPQIDNKNIIQIIPNMEIGGAEKTVLEIGAYLKNTHYEPIVLPSGGGMIENLKEKKIKVLTRKIDQKNPYKIFTNIELDWAKDCLPDDLECLFNINPIYFDLDKYYIRRDAAKELKKVYTVMIRYPNIKIHIESHTDSRASNRYNLALSYNRARSTKSWDNDAWSSEAWSSKVRQRFATIPYWRDGWSDTKT